VLGDQVVLGAGTVLDSETARVAILAGAEFIVSPNLNFDVIAMTKRYSKVSVPAGLTATEVVAGWEAGADFIKVFPCGCVGGPQYIKALKSPLPQIEMIPTGGVNLENAGDYIRAGAAAVAVGAELVDKEAVKNKTLHIITEKTRRYLEELKDARSEKGPWSAL
jgi:2-dehydro-3-deoxyphosphogluconate aldolase/(4S)-4-hydroxy-2-oxoglutarate aldolase